MGTRTRYCSGMSCCIVQRLMPQSMRKFSACVRSAFLRLQKSSVARVLYSFFTTRPTFGLSDGCKKPHPWPSCHFGANGLLPVLAAIFIASLPSRRSCYKLLRKSSLHQTTLISTVPYGPLPLSCLRQLSWPSLSANIGSNIDRKKGSFHPPSIGRGRLGLPQYARGHMETPAPWSNIVCRQSYIAYWL